MKRTLVISLVVATLGFAASGEEILTNGDFADGKLAPWKLFIKDGQPEAKATVEDGALCVAAAAAATTPHERQLIQDVSVESGKKYVLSLDVRGSSAGAEEIVVVLARTKFFSKGHYGLFRKFTPGLEWGTQSFTFTTKDIDDDDPPALKFNLGALSGPVYFRNISLRPKP